MVSITLPDAKLPFIWMQVRCWPELPLVSPTKRSWTTLGTFKDSCELQARIHTISTYILSWKVSNRKKAGAPKNQLWPLEKESFNESFLLSFSRFSTNIRLTALLSSSWPNLIWHEFWAWNWDFGKIFKNYMKKIYLLFVMLVPMECRWVQTII